MKYDNSGSIIPESAHKKQAIQVSGAPSGIRTRDPLIKSQLFYQLS